MLLGTPDNVAPAGKLICAATNSLSGLLGSATVVSTYSVVRPRSVVSLATKSSPV